MCKRRCIVGLTYNRLQDVVAWHGHDFGGTDAKCKSVAAIDIDTAEDQVYVIVERTIDGATKKYVSIYRLMILILHLLSFIL